MFIIPLTIFDIFPIHLYIKSILNTYVYPELSHIQKKYIKKIALNFKKRFLVELCLDSHKIIREENNQNKRLNSIIKTKKK